MENKETKDSRVETLEHIKRVAQLMTEAATELIRRANVHDDSKLKSPEKEMFDEVTNKLRGLTYGSPEYTESLKFLKPALDHHYANNDHHPQYFSNGINGMDLFSIIEMFFDWKAAGERHADGNIYKSIEFNKGRFSMSEQLVDIFTNTADRLGYIRPNPKYNTSDNTNTPNPDAEILVFDVESTDLYGEGFAFGAIVMKIDGTIIDQLQLLSKEGAKKANQWVTENVLPHLTDMPTCETQKELRSAFYSFYFKYKSTVKVWSDCNYPVETNFLAAVVADDKESREWNMPFPLMDISTIVDNNIDRMAECGIQGLKKHNPLDDSKASAAMLIKKLDHLNPKDKVKQETQEDY